MIPNNININLSENITAPLIASNLTVAYFLHLKDQHDPEKAAKQIVDVFLVFQAALSKSDESSSHPKRSSQL